MRVIRKETLFLFIALFLASACGTAEHSIHGTASSDKPGTRKEQFRREATFPEGEQTSLLVGGFLSGLKDVNTETWIFDSPYKDVWEACIHASEQLDKVGKRPIVVTNPKSGRIQNGKISEDAMVGMGIGAWLDEIGIDVTEISKGQTKVAVTRKVIENVHVGGRVGRKWQTQLSSGKLEWWVLTQIADGVNKPVDSQSQKTPSVQQETNKKADVITGSGLVILQNANIRSEPNSKSKILLTLKSGDKVIKLGESGSWYNVKLSSGQTGWVFKTLVKESK